MRTTSLIGFVLATALVISCSSEQAPEVRDRSPPPVEKVEPKPEPVLPKPEPEPPPKPVELPPLDNSCKVDADCIPAPGCCPKPCTPVVINKNAMAEAKRRLEDICPKPPRCGSAGGCRNHAYLCVEGTCALVFEGDENYRERRDQ